MSRGPDAFLIGLMLVVVIMTCGVACEVFS